MQSKLYALRKEAKITQSEMAKMLNINVHTYINKELGYSPFTANEMFAISKIFKDKKIEDIFLPNYVPKRKQKE